MLRGGWGASERKEKTITKMEEKKVKRVYMMR